MQKAKRYFFSKILFKSAIILISVLGFGCSAIKASTIKDTCNGKGSVYGYTSIINLKQQDSMYVRLSNKKASYMLPINNISIEYKREFSKENIDAGAYELHLVKKGVMKNCGNVVIKADSTALLQIAYTMPLDQFAEMKENEITNEIHYVEKRPFNERGVIEGRILEPPFEALITVSEYILWNAAVDSIGNFHINNVLPGIYDLSIQPADENYISTEIHKLKVKAGYISIVNLILYPEMLQLIDLNLIWKEEYKKERKND